MELRKQQDAEREEFEAQQDELQIQAEENKDEEFEREVRSWQEFKYAPFKTKKIQFVVCLNTLGQDRCFTQGEIDFALKTVRSYRINWEKKEKQNLERDVQLKLKYFDFDRLYIEHYAAKDDQRMEEYIDEAIAAAESQQIADGEDPLTDL